MTYNRRLLALVPIVLTISCAATVGGKFDQAHILYNQASSVALAYAEKPDADETARQAIAATISRTGPVVIKASQVLDDPAVSKDEKRIYAEWAAAVLEEAVRQLTELVMGR